MFINKSSEEIKLPDSESSREFRSGRWLINFRLPDLILIKTPYNESSPAKDL